MGDGKRNSRFIEVNIKIMISIVNYGMGNIRSIQNALEFLGFDSYVASDSQEILASQKLILPGVGSFALAMENIKQKGLFEVLNESVIVKKIPILGICLGMQLLADDGEEDGLSYGFGWIPGSVRRFEADKLSIKIPHIGFNTVYFNQKNNLLFNDLGISADFYFVHSYKMICKDEIYISSWADYGEKFVTSVQKENIFGVQFHPEKSQSNGLKVLRSFCKI